MGSFPPPVVLILKLVGLGLMKLTGKDEKVFLPRSNGCHLQLKNDQTAIRMLNDYAALFKSIKN